MPDVVKHAWTHRPREQGGTDPVPFPEPTWATATMFDTSLSKTTSYYRPLFTHLGTNDPDNFTLVDGGAGTSQYLWIAKPGYYVARFGVTTQGGSHVWQAQYTALQAIANVAGSDSPINAGTDAFSDWSANDFSKGNEQFKDDFHAADDPDPGDAPGHRGLWTTYTFNYDPLNPTFGDLSFESPLGIAVRVLAGRTGSVSMTAQVNVIRLCAAGYELQDLTA